MGYYVLRLNEKRLDRLLLDAIVDALADAGIEAQERLDRLRRDEHSLTLGDTNLLDYYYCSAANQLQELLWVTEGSYKSYLPCESQYYKAYSSESRFIFVGEEGCSVRLCLACRLPDSAAREAAISVELNAEPQVEILISREWSSWEIGLAGEAVRDGLNEVKVRWPIPEFASDEALERAVSNLYERKFPDFYPVFGEIHSFTASNGPEVSRSLSALQELSVEVA
jgi:hypothetical protein